MAPVLIFPALLRTIQGRASAFTDFIFMKEAPVPEPLRMNLPIQTATIRPGVKCIRNMIVIHDMPDDFRTQPSGNSGEKIACGQIVAEDPDIR